MNRSEASGQQRQGWTGMSIAPRLTAEFKASVAAAVEDSATFPNLNHKTFGFCTLPAAVCG